LDGLKNFRIEEANLPTFDLSKESGRYKAAQANVEALKVLDELRKGDVAATPEQQRVLAQYVGWGAMVEAFNRDRITRVSWQDTWKDAEQKTWEKKWLPISRELMQRLAPEQYQTARESSLTAFYTSREVVKSMWGIAEQLGFRGGAVLEPSAGSGVFIGMMPEHLERQSRVTAVEMEDISAGVLGHLYQNSRVIQGGYESACIPNASQDLVIGNFPFGDMKVIDKENPEAAKHSIHNYFFLKSLDKLKPGGLIIALTSSWSMDSKSAGWRQAMAERADLVGAIRLPNNAFQSVAGTQVVTDLLVFRKKSQEPFQGKAFVATEEIHLGQNRYGQDIDVPLNQYFHEHPENVLGEYALGGLYNQDQMTVVPDPEEPDLALAIRQVVDTAFPKDILQPQAKPEPSKGVENWRKLMGDEKDGLLVLHEGKPYIVGRSEYGEKVLVDPFPSETRGLEARLNALAARLESYVPMREALKELIAEQLEPEGSETRIEALRAELNRLYEVFTAEGSKPINGKGAHPDLSLDVEWPLVQALEVCKAVEGPDGKPVKTYEKAEILRRRTLFPHKEPTEAQSLEEALAISMAYRGKVDTSYVSSMVNEPEEKVRVDLVSQHLAFVDPKTGLFEMAEDYLSGAVREKLEIARAALDNEPSYAANVEALEAVQPPELPIQAITCKLGAGGWLPAEVLEQFAREVLGLNFGFRYNKAASLWEVRGDRWSVDDYGKATKWGSARVHAGDLLKDSVSMKRHVVRVPHPIEEGKMVVDQNATIQAQAQQEKIEAEFVKFVRENPKIARVVENAYNRVFNSFVRKQWRVPNLEHFPGASQEIKLEPYQKRVVARAMQEPTMMSHVVGSGKTFSLITTAMEMRRLGIARKPMIVVQNSTLAQFVASFRRLYPTANILAPNERDREAANRQRLMSRIATGDYDAVVIPHSFFDMIPDDPQRVKWYVAQQITELEEALEAAKRGSGRRGDDKRVTGAIRSKMKFYQEMGDRAERILDGVDAASKASDEGRGRKRSRREKDNIKAVYKRKQRLLDKMSRRTDRQLTFESLGVDALMVDEAHRYKRRDFVTNIDRSVRSIDRGSSQRSMGLLMKANYVREQTNGKNVILATGTPISNTIAEVWTMMGYLRPDLLNAYTVDSFDAFVGAFAQISTELEMTYSGEFKPVSRLRRFVNGPELLTMWGAASDNVRTEDITRVSLPRLKGGKMAIIDLEPTEATAGAIAYWRDVLVQWQKSEHKRDMPHIPILVMGRSRQISVDPRLVDPDLSDVKGSKIETAVDNVHGIWERGSAQRLTQLVFCDLYQSAGVNKKGRRFNVYQAVKDKLVARGVPANEIEIVTPDAKKNDEAMARLFERVQSGEVRILLGGTQSLGIGVNVQDRLKAVHHLDLPMIPADLEQRNGRIIRAGNMNEEIEIYSYGVRRTLDSALAQIIQNKARFIQQVMEGQVNEREFEDPSGSIALSAAEMLAAYADDPVVFRKIHVEVELQRLRQAKAAFADEKRDIRMRINSQAENEVVTGKILHSQRRVVEQLQVMKEELPALEEAIKGYNLVAEILEEIPDQVAKLDPNKTDTSQPILRRPAPLVLGERWTIQPKIIINLHAGLDDEKKKSVVKVWSSSVQWSVAGIPEERFAGQYNSGQGGMLLKSIQASIKRAEEAPALTEVSLRNIRATLTTLREQIEAPFDRQRELDELEAELAQLNKELEERGKAIADKTVVEKAEDLDALEEAFDAGLEEGEKEEQLAEAV
jgi:N12 class adenine-specific DNA methylase